MRMYLALSVLCFGLCATAAADAKKERPVVDCAKLLSVDDVVAACGANAAKLTANHSGTGKRPSGCRAEVKTTVKGQMNSVLVNVETNLADGGAAAKLKLVRADKTAKDVSVGDEGVRRTQTVTKQVNEWVHARKGQLYMMMNTKVREGEEPVIACSEEGLIKLATLVMSRIP